MIKTLLNHFLVSSSVNRQSKTCPEQGRRIKNQKWIRIVAIGVAFATCGAVAQAHQPKKVPRIGYLSNTDPARESTRAEWFNWRSVASGVILSSVAAILAWPKIEPWQLVLLIAFSMGIGVWAANGFLLLWDKMYTANTHVHSMDNKSPPLSTSAASNQLANNVSEKKASDLKAASISIKAHLGFRAQSIECSFKNMTLHGMTECVYFVTNLQQWSPEHADYFRETEEFVPFAIKGPPKLESGNLETHYGPANFHRTRGGRLLCGPLPCAQGLLVARQDSRRGVEEHPGSNRALPGAR